MGGGHVLLLLLLNTSSHSSFTPCHDASSPPPPPPNTPPSPFLPSPFLHSALTTSLLSPLFATLLSHYSFPPLPPSTPPLRYVTPCHAASIPIPPLTTLPVPRLLSLTSSHTSTPFSTPLNPFPISPSFLPSFLPPALLPPASAPPLTLHAGKVEVEARVSVYHAPRSGTGVPGAGKAPMKEDGKGKCGCI